MTQSPGIFYQMGIGGANHVNQQIAQTDNRFNNLGSTVKKVAAAVAGVFAIAKLKSMISASMDALDAQQKLARSVDGSVEAIRNLELAAANTGVSTGALTASMQGLNQKIGEAINGNEQAKAAFDAFGISAQELAKMDTDKRFEAIAKRSKELGLSTSQTSAYLKKMGMAGKEMALLMQDGGDAIRSAADDMKKLGLNINEIDTAKIETANDKLNLVKKVFQGIIDQFAIYLAPLISELSDLFIDVAIDAGGTGRIVEKVMRAITKSVGFVADAIRGWQYIIKGIVIAFYGLRASVNTIMASMVGVFENIINSITSQINVLIRAFNAIPGATKLGLEEIKKYSSDAKNVFKNDAEYWKNKMDETVNDLTALAMTPMPSSKIEQWMDGVQEKWTKAAKEVADANQKMRDDNAKGIVTPEASEKVTEYIKKLKEQTEEIGKTSEEVDKLRMRRALEGEATAEQIEQIDELIAAMHRKKEADDLLSQAENFVRSGIGLDEITRLEHQQAAELELLEVAFENKLIAEEDYLSRRNALNQEYDEAYLQAKLYRIDQEARASLELASSLGGAFESIADAMQSSSEKQSSIQRAMVAASKMAATAEAMMAIQVSIAKAAAAGPPPANIPFITQAVSTGAGIISGLKRVNYGGGRQFGGPVQAGSQYRINETGVPEVRSSGGKDYLMETRNAMITPLDKFLGGGDVQNIVNNYASGIDVKTRTNGTGGVTVEIVEKMISNSMRKQEQSIAGQFQQNRGAVYNAARAGTTLRGEPGRE